MASQRPPDLLKISWNSKEEWVRPGAKVESLLSSEEWEACQNGKAIVKDSRGHETGLSGTLTAGVQLHIEYIDIKKNTS